MSNPFLEAAKAGDLPSIKLMLGESPARITEVDDGGNTALILAAEHGQLESVKWLLKEGGASIVEADDGHSALIGAAQSGQLETVKWLLKEGGASIGDADIGGWTALLAAALYGKLATTQHLLEHGGADIGDTLINGRTIWDVLAVFLDECVRFPDDEDDNEPYVYDATVVTSLLRVMVLQDAPPAELTARLSPEHAQVVEEGARLRARLPAYIVQRRALLDAHCPLIPPLRALVHGYEEPTTTEELWATGLGAARQGAVRPRASDGAAVVPLRRSLRLRQKCE
jgi:hypothetical protein